MFAGDNRTSKYSHNSLSIYIYWQRTLGCRIIFIELILSIDWIIDWKIIIVLDRKAKRMMGIYNSIYFRETKLIDDREMYLWTCFFSTREKVIFSIKLLLVLSFYFSAHINQHEDSITFSNMSIIILDTFEQKRINKKYWISKWNTQLTFLLCQLVW